MKAFREVSACTASGGGQLLVAGCREVNNPRLWCFIKVL